jgi:hypothetical protein
MKIEKSVLIINAVLFGVCLFLMIAGGGFEAAGFGLAFLFMAFIDLLLVVIYAIQGKRSSMLNALILAGVLVTIGFSVCSGSNMNFH